MATNCDPSVLVGQSACLSCIPEGMRLAVLNYLLCQIANTGVAGTTLPSGQIFVGNAANVATAVAMSGEGAIDNTGAFTGTKFVSANLVLNVQSWTLNHAFTIAPSKTRAVLVCTVNDANTGYQVDDEIDVAGFFDSTAVAPSFSVFSRASQQRCQSGVIPIGNEARFLVVHKNGGSWVNPTSFNNFAMKIYASP